MADRRPEPGGIERLVLRVGALIVPSTVRREWVADWTAELIVARKALRGRLSRLRLLARMSALLGDWSRQRRFVTSMLVAFAILAVTLAAVGVYGLLAFTVTQRMSELGVRRALGANRADIVAVVLRNGLTLALVGAAIGVPASAALSRVLGGLLFGMTPLDAITFAMTTGIVVAAALVAALQPALKAARIDPLVTLRRD